MAESGDHAAPSDSSSHSGQQSSNAESTPEDYLQGIDAAKQGCHREAVAAFRRSVENNPDHAPSHANLGAALANMGEYAEAVDTLESAVRLVPGDVKSLANLASCLHLIGRFRPAVERAEQALARNPSGVSSLRTVVLSSLEIGDGGRALRAANSLVRIAPSRETHQLLIRSLMAAGRFTDAEGEAGRYVNQMKRTVAQSEQSSDEAARQIALAELLRAQTIRARNRTLKPTGPHLPLVRQRRQELLTLLLQIVRDAPIGDAYFELGRAYHDLHQHEEAELALRTAVDLQPENAAALELLGDVLIERSLNDEAVEMLDRALTVNPHQSKALLMRVKTAASEAEREVFHAKLDEYLALPDTRPIDRINWNFAKAQLFDKAKDYHQAFNFYLQAGRLKEEGLKRNGPGATGPDNSSAEGDPAADHQHRHQRHYDGSQKVFTPEFFVSRKELANPSVRPIFVVGVPRSGTTLMEQILASHPVVAGAGELPEFSSFAVRCEKLTKLHGGYPAGFASVPQETLSSFAQEYLEQLNRVSSTAERIVDKMPGNLIHVGLIHTLFPNASIVRIRREPRDVCVSALKNHLDFPFCNLEKTARFCVACDRLSDLWNEVLPGRVLQLNYEELVTDLEPNVRRLLEHCNLEWDDRCLEFYRTERNVRTPSRWQVRKPAYNSSIGAWKRYADSLTHLDAILGPAD